MSNALKKPALYIFCMVYMFTNQSKAQYNEYGGGLGNLTYIGDVNQSFVPNKLNYAFSAFYKRNSKTYASALRLQLSFLKIAGNSSSESNLARFGEVISFSNSTLELSALYEYNFLDFGKKLANTNRKVFFTPYVFAGIGTTYTLSSKNSFSSSSSFPNFSPIVPMGVGMKALLTHSLVIGAEINFRKTFSDKLDGINDDQLSSSSTGTDLYYTLGFNLSYIINGIFCPIHLDGEPSGKIIKGKKLPFFE